MDPESLVRTSPCHHRKFSTPELDTEARTPLESSVYGSRLRNGEADDQRWRQRAYSDDRNSIPYTRTISLLTWVLRCFQFEFRSFNRTFSLSVGYAHRSRMVCFSCIFAFLMSATFGFPIYDRECGSLALGKIVTASLVLKRWVSHRCRGHTRKGTVFGRG